MKQTHIYFTNLLCFCILLVCTFFFPSCKKFLAVPPPDTAVQGEEVFNNSGTAIAAVAGLYGTMMQTSLAISNGGATVYGALSAGELYNTATNADYDQFKNHNISPVSTTGLNRLWTFAYRNIYAANAIIEGLAKSSALPDSLKSTLTGEMLLVRSLNYFYLVNFFGAVPLVTATAFDENKGLPRSSVDDIWTSIEKDLKEAKGKLSASYPSAGRIRPNKWTAAALLARVYLYRQNWAGAESEASAIINSGTYTLAALNNVFLANSTEAIWQLSPVSTTINTAEGNTFNPSSTTAKPTFAVTDTLLKSFESGDGRKGAWLKSNTVSGVTYFYPYKYKVRTGAPPYGEYYAVFRLAEIFLIRAEARAQLNKLPEAKDDLDRVRIRAGLLGTTANTQTLLLKAIEAERRIELAFEWAHRWFDLKRWGRVDAVISAIDPASWQSTDALYPIPQYELDTNPFLTQNPGY